MQTKIKLLDPRAEIPKRAHETDTGYDIKIIDLKSIEGDTLFFRTGIALTPPEDYYWEILPRSNISKLPLIIANSVGVVDEGYIGELLIAVKVTHQEMGLDKKSNHYPTGIVKFLKFTPHTLSEVANLVITQKPNIFQLILRQRLSSDFIVVDELVPTVRGDGGFGSTL